MSISGTWDRGGAGARGWGDRARSTVGVLLIAAAWEVGPRVGAVDAEFLPPLSEVLKTVWSMALDGSLARHVGFSSVRAVVGVCVAFVVAAPTGLLLGFYHPRSYLALVPSLRLLSHINPFAMMPAFLLFFGAGEVVKIVVVAWMAFWPIFFYSVTGSIHVDRDLVRVGRSFGLSPVPMFRQVLLPAAFPIIVVGLRIAVCLAFFILVAAEMLGASGGVGWLVHNSAMNYHVRGVYAAALLVVWLGYCLDRGLRQLETWLVPHAPRMGAERHQDVTPRKAFSGGPWLIRRVVEASG